MNIITTVFGNKKERILRTCTKLYKKAKKERPGRKESEYYKIILLTKPPFDYQYENVIGAILESTKSIGDLAKQIYMHGQINSHLWVARERNIKKGRVVEKNQEFIRKFWE